MCQGNRKQVLQPSCDQNPSQVLGHPSSIWEKYNFLLFNSFKKIIFSSSLRVCYDFVIAREFMWATCFYLFKVLAPSSSHIANNYRMKWHSYALVCLPEQINMSGKICLFELFSHFLFFSKFLYLWVTDISLRYICSQR